MQVRGEPEDSEGREEEDAERERVAEAKRRQRVRREARVDWWRVDVHPGCPLSPNPTSIWRVAEGRGSRESLSSERDERSGGKTWGKRRFALLTLAVLESVKRSQPSVSAAAERVGQARVRSRRHLGSNHNAATREGACWNALEVLETAQSAASAHDPQQRRDEATSPSSSTSSSLDAACASHTAVGRFSGGQIGYNNTGERLYKRRKLKRPCISPSTSLTSSRPLAPLRTRLSLQQALCARLNEVQEAKEPLASLPTSSANLGASVALHPTIRPPLPLTLNRVISPAPPRSRA